MMHFERVKATLPAEIDRERYELTWINIVEKEDSESNDILEKRIIVEISEKNIVPKQLKEYGSIISHGNAKDICLNDFPQRAMACTLVFKRKRWKIVDTWKVVCIDIKAKQDWTRGTKELLIFLK